MKTRAAVLQEIGCPQPYVASRPLVIEDVSVASAETSSSWADRASSSTS
jgi:hypothetical protein